MSSRSSPSDLDKLLCQRKRASSSAQASSTARRGGSSTPSSTDFSFLQDSGVQLDADVVPPEQVYKSTGGGGRR